MRNRHHHHTVRLLLDGPVGSGKSVTLLQLSDYLLRSRRKDSKEFIIYSSRLSRWTAGYYPYQQNEGNPQEYDQSQLAIEIMKQIAVCNHELPTINDMISQAEENSVFAIQNLKQILEIISTSQGQTFILVDELNALFAPTGYRDINSQPLSIERLPVLKMMRDFYLNPKFTLIGAFCHSNPALVDSKLNGTLLEASVESLPYFSDNEVFCLLEYYKSLGQLTQKVSPKYAQKIRFISGGSGGKILPATHYDVVYQR